MTDQTKQATNDPMGLDALSAVVQRLVALRDETTSDMSANNRFSLIVAQLEERFAATQQKYDLLKDRYALLKRSNAALCDELVWLRDQLDDLSSPGA